VPGRSAGTAEDNYRDQSFCEGCQLGHGSSFIL
jgi:hypothetical protein